MKDSFDKHLTQLFEMQNLEADSHTRVLEQILKNQSNFLETFQRVDTPIVLEKVLTQLTEKQAEMLRTLSDKSSVSGGSFAKSIEEALKKQMINNPKADYRLLISEMDESRLNELSNLREILHPRAVSFLSGLIQFTLENDILKVNFTNPDIEFLEFDKECAYFLGFHNCIVRNGNSASNGIDFFGNISTLYVYCDTVDKSIVGNSKTSLLTVIPCKGRFGEMIQHTFPIPRYLPLMNGNIDSIKISILNEFGEPVNCNWGSSIITLHIKKIV